jgi:N-methylhydantoinase B/oxoprolinase/acetone carboxylase alpha subunit
MKTRTNAEWLADLRADAKTRDATLADLRAAVSAHIPRMKRLALVEPNAFTRDASATYLEV